MRDRSTRCAFVLGTAVMLLVSVAGCGASDDNAQKPLSIVAKVQIDANGHEIEDLADEAPANPAGNGNATCPPVDIAVAAPLTGPAAVQGVNIKNGVQLALDKHNNANPNCQVQVKLYDTEGDVQKAAVYAPQIVADAATVGLVGPAFSGETKATGGVFNDAGLVAATASATNATLSEQGWRTFFRGVANDDVQGPAVANYMKNSMGLNKLCVVDDKSEYGRGLADAVRRTLGDLADANCNISVKRTESDFAAAVSQIKGIAPGGVFFAGYYGQAAKLVDQLRDGGVTATFVSGDGTKDPQFVKQAGDASRDSALSCPCGPAPDSFAIEYTQKFGQPPGTYSTEAYDLATILLRGIDSGANTRPALLDFVRNYQGKGVARDYKWTPTGELTMSSIWMYNVQ